MEPFPSANEQPVRSLFDLITSQMNHWKVWNGRFTGHSIVQIFMQYNKEVFNVFNSSVFLSLGILIDSLSFDSCPRLTMVEGCIETKPISI